MGKYLVSYKLSIEKIALQLARNGEWRRKERGEEKNSVW